MGHEEKPVREWNCFNDGWPNGSETLADLGEEVRPDADAQGRGDALTVSGQRPGLLPASERLRRGQGTQQQDHGQQTDSVGLPESEALQDRIYCLSCSLDLNPRCTIKYGAHSLDRAVLFEFFMLNLDRIEHYTMINLERADLLAPQSSNSRLTRPLVSIITPSFNQGQFLQQAISSVLKQNYDFIEHIVIDGGSVDNSVEILSETQSPWPKIFRWTSQPDGGQAIAVNQGFCSANGSIIGWLNSDDVLLPNAVALITEYFSTHSEHLMVYGGAMWIDASGMVVGQYPTQPPEKAHAFLEGCFLCQPAVFFRSDLIREIGLLDPSLVTAMDYDYWIRVFKAFPGRIGYIPKHLALSRLHDTCKTVSQRKQVYLESMAVVSRHLSDLPTSWFFSYVEECFKKAQFDHSQMCNRQELLIFFKAAMHYYDREKRAVIKDRLRRDRRLTLNSDTVKIDVTDDGWTGQECSITICRFRQINNIRIDIVHERPVDSPIKLGFYSCGHVLSEFAIPKNGRYALSVPLYKLYQEDDFLVIKLVCDSTFVPSQESSDSSDCRSLGIAIVGIKLECDKVTSA